MTTLTLSCLNSASEREFLAQLDSFFEHSPWIVQETYQRRPFSSFDELLAELTKTMWSSSPTQQMALIRAHPDLATKLGQESLTKSSQEEQAGVGLDRLTPEEFERFSDHNQAYRQKFGFPFIICAKLQTKESILVLFAQRLENTKEAEVVTALREIEKIATLRFRALVPA